MANNITRDEAATRSAVVHTAAYQVALNLATAGETFDSTTTVRFDSRAGAATFIDLVPHAIHSIVLNGEVLDESVYSDGRIRLNHLKDHNELVVHATCDFTTSGQGVHRFVDPETQEIFLYTQFADMYACTAFTVFDQPDIKGTFQFTVLAPDHWNVISNSVAPRPTPVADASVEIAGETHGVRRWEFAPTPLLPCYATAVCAGPYVYEETTIVSSKGEIPARVYGRPQLLDHFDSAAIFGDTQRGFELYERIFETEFPYDSYDQIYVPQYNFGAMENAGCVTISEDALLFRTRVADSQYEFRSVVVLHELAHMWFGDLVTMKWWDDLWLNESFAEYVATYAAAEVTPWQDAWVTFAALRKSVAYATDQLPTTHPVLSDLPDVRSVAGTFDMITYAKGASALKQLAATLGEEVFFSGVAAYLRKHAWGNATLSDLFAELEAVSGQDLTAWRTAWLETPGLTTLHAEIENDYPGLMTKFEIIEDAPEQWPLPRPHRLSVGGYRYKDGHLTKVFSQPVTVHGHRTEVPELIDVPRPDLLLINDDDLTYAKAHLDERSLGNMSVHLTALTDAMPQAIVLDAMWHMCRDAAIPAREYVDAVLTAMPMIVNSTVLDAHSRSLVTAVQRYTHPEAVAELSASTAERVWEILADAVPGSDTQLQLLSTYATLACTDAQADRVEGLLNDTIHLESLPIDTELTWDLVTTLAACGRADDAVIDEYLGKDATAAGQRRAAGARAAIGTLDAKWRAWNAIAHPEGKPMANALMYEAALGLARANDPGLMAPLVDDFFESLRPFFESNDMFVALRASRYAFPTYLAGHVDGLPERIDAWLATNTDADAVLIKVVTEGGDHVRRALAAQARSAQG